MTLVHRLEQLRITGFRNITDLSLAFSPRLNVITGDNGQGKTSVLEALYFLSTSRSFRTERSKELVQEGASLTRVQGVFLEGQLQREQRAVLSNGRRVLTIDGKVPERLSSYAVRSPIVIFHPGDLQLVSGTASLRRRLLDRVALFSDAAAGDSRLNYQKALRERQQVLQSRGSQAQELDVFEQLMARYGVELGKARAGAAKALELALLPAFESMAAADLRLELEYLPGGTEDPAFFAHELQKRREGDRRRKAPNFGPQRDDVDLSINGRSARRHASQGQQRVLTLALKVAELACIRETRGVEPILLLDDVSSELDPTRVGAVYEFIRSTQSQVFVTTTRSELFQMAGFEGPDRCDFRLHRGALASAPN